jgi:hypothetical protein
MTSFPNMAGVKNCDAILEEELRQAGIRVEKLPEYMREDSGEVDTVVMVLLDC